MQLQLPLPGSPEVKFCNKCPYDPNKIARPVIMGHKAYCGIECYNEHRRELYAQNNDCA